MGGVGQAQPAAGHGAAGPEVTARRFRAPSPPLAWVLGGAVLVLAAAAVVLSAFAGQLSIDITAGVVIVLTFAGVGLVIARRQPGHPIGGRHRRKDAVDLDSIRDDLAGVIHQALEPSRLSVWVSHRD